MARHRFGVITAAVVSVAILAVAAVAVWQAVEATRRRDRALSLAHHDEALKAYEVALASAVKTGNEIVRIGTLAYRANTYLMMGEVDRAERELAVVTPEIGKSVSADSVPAMVTLQAQARLDGARSRHSEAVAGYTRVIEFFAGRKMTVAPLARALIARGEVRAEAGKVDAAMEDAERALKVARSLQGGKPYSSCTGFAMLLLARIHKIRANQQEAQEASTKAWQNLAKTLRDTHPSCLQARKLSHGPPAPI